MNKQYIGDGIYFRVGDFHGQYVLTTEDGVSETNVIYVETHHIDAIVRLIAAHEKLVRQATEQEPRP